MEKEECLRAAALVRATPIRSRVRLNLPAFLLAPDGSGRELHPREAAQLRALGNQRKRARISAFGVRLGRPIAIGVGFSAGVAVSMLIRTII